MLAPVTLITLVHQAGWHLLACEQAYQLVFADKCHVRVNY